MWELGTTLRLFWVYADKQIVNFRFRQEMLRSQSMDKTKRKMCTYFILTIFYKQLKPQINADEVICKDICLNDLSQPNQHLSLILVSLFLIKEYLEDSHQLVHEEIARTIEASIDPYLHQNNDRIRFVCFSILILLGKFSNSNH